MKCPNCGFEIKVPANSNREYLKFKKDQCESCGKQGKLVVHHIDHDHWNNDLTNLITLCTKCHAEVDKSQYKNPDPIIRKESCRLRVVCQQTDQEACNTCKPYTVGSHYKKPQR